MPEKVPQEEHVREFVRSCVRAGLLDAQSLYGEVVQAVASELPELRDRADAVARDWIAAYREELARDQAQWPEVTDHDRLQAAFAELAAADVVVLQGCEDHWDAKAVLDRRAEAGNPPRGIAWFTPPDVWHAIDEGMLEVNLWHGSTANVAPGDALLDEAVAVFERHGLPAHFDEGRIEVAAHWQKRLDDAR
ncbi:MAG TPA: hypothetical protein VF049_19555 [Nocardioidaceae bacterium]